MRISLFIVLFAISIRACSPGDQADNIGTLYAESEAFYDLIPREAVIKNVGVNFQFTEGPAWHRDGYLLFSDIPGNRIIQLRGRKFKTFREPSNNANGLLTLKDGSVIACEHGSRSITRMSQDGSMIVLADHYRGARLNSPNDLCRNSSGIIYFTDPPWGLSGRNNDPAKELSFNGVYMIRDGEVELIDSTLSWPNGIALSPDEDILYVANFENSDSEGSPNEVFWMRYELNSEGEAVGRSRFFTAPDPDLPGGPDGMKVDKKGNVFATGPGGILVIDPDGHYLGRIELPVIPANLVFGPGEKELYVTARSTLVHIPLE